MKAVCALIGIRVLQYTVGQVGDGLFFSLSFYCNKMDSRYRKLERQFVGALANAGCNVSHLTQPIRIRLKIFDLFMR